MLDELQVIVDGAGEPFRALNALTRDRDADAVCRAAVARLGTRGWPAEAILTRVRRARHDAARRAGTPDDPEADAGRIQAWIERARRARARPDTVAQRWLEARAELPRTRLERAQWWTRSRDAYADCEAWAETDGYPVPPAVVWGTTLTRLGITSVVRPEATAFGCATCGSGPRPKPPADPGGPSSGVLRLTRIWGVPEAT